MQFASDTQRVSNLKYNDNRYLRKNGTAAQTVTGAVSFTGDVTGLNHDFLSATHGDTTAGTVTRGDIITGQTATPKWRRLPIGTNGYFLKSNGTEAAWAAHGLTYSDVGAAPAAHGVSTPYIPYASSATAFNESNLYYDVANTRLGIGTTSPAETLTVNGSAQFGGRKYHQTSGITTGAGVVNGFNVTLNLEHGTTLNVNYNYKISLTTGTTSTDSGALYIVHYIQNTTTWVARAVSMSGTSGNNPQLSISGSNVVAWTNHASAYGIYILVESLEKVNDDGTAHGMGADYHWQRFISDLYYTDGNVGIGTSSAQRRLESSVEDAVTDSVTYAARLSHFTSGDAADGMGTGLEFVTEDLYGTVVVLSTIEAVGTGMGNTHPHGDLLFKTYYEDGGGLAERMRISYNGTISVKDNNITDINTLTFHNASNYIIKVQEDADTGLYYDVSSHVFSFRQNATERATVDLSNGNMTMGRATVGTCQEFADNAAAVAGGLTTGMLYRTGDAVKIVHA